MTDERHATTWSDDEDRRLIALWSERKSIGELAWEFPGRTRNACIGRLTRLRKKLGVEMIPPGKQGRAGQPAIKRKRVRRKTPNSYAINRQVPIEAAPLTRSPPALPAARRLPLLELGPTDCRFIVTDHQTRQHLYCAVDASAFVDKYGNGCYCAFHQRLMRVGRDVR